MFIKNKRLTDSDSKKSAEDFKAHKNGKHYEK